MVVFAKTRYTDELEEWIVGGDYTDWGAERSQIVADIIGLEKRGEFKTVRGMRIGKMYQHGFMSRVYVWWER